MKVFLIASLVAATALLSALPVHAAPAPEPAVEQTVSAHAAPQPATHWLLFTAAGALGVGMLNARTLRDLNNTKSKALPAAGATSYTDPLDTALQNPGRFPENAELLIELPATPSLVDAKTITLTVEDSADGVTFAALADIPPMVALGAGGVGAAAIARNFKLPIACRQFLRLQQDVLAAGGDNTAISGTISFIF